MKGLFRIGFGLVLAAAVIAGLARAWDSGVEQDKQEVARVIGRMKTVCIGRFLIDLPAEAQYEFRGSRIRGFDVAAFDESDSEFRARVLARKAQLEAVADKPGGHKNLELMRQVKNDHGAVGHVFVHNRDVTEGQSSDGLTVERFRYEGISVEALLHGNGISIDISAADYDPNRVENVMKLIGQFVPNPENRIPTEPGFCIDRAYIGEPLSADDGEQIMMAAWLPDRPDIQFRMILAAGTEPDRQGLLERGAASYAALNVGEQMRVKKLRARKRSIGGIIGEELIERIIEKRDVSVHSFWWEVNGTKDNVLVPHVVFRMNTGHGDNGPVPSSLSDVVALGVWDRIASSIRLRPTVLKTGAPTRPRIPSALLK